MEPVGRIDNYRKLGDAIRCQGKINCKRHKRTRPYGTPCAHCGYITQREVEQGALIEDVEWMLATGEIHAETISHRVGMKPACLARRLRRMGRPELLMRMTGMTDEVMGKRRAA